jgi:transposase
MDVRSLTNSLLIHTSRWTGAEVVLDASGAADQGVCPTCGVASSYVHDQYVRRPRDLPWRGRRVRLNLVVRRFRCQNEACPRHTFAEDFDPALRRYAHYTAEAEAMLLRYGRTAGGEVGARLAVCTGLPASGDTLLRLLRRSAATPAVIPHVLGVDEFSLARRHRYGTVLVDLETHEPIDLLNGHKAEPVAAWLRDHPGVEVFVRDRAGAFSDAARQGAPEAIQVADRFHLLQNAGQALDELLRGRRRRIEHAVIHAEPPPATAPAAPERPPSKERLRSEAARQRRVGRWETVRARHAAGESVSRIARDLGMSRMTVRHLLRTPEPPPPMVMPRPGGLRSPLLQPYVSYLQDRWQAGCTNFAQLTREIRALGYAGSGSLVSQALLPWRPPRLPRGIKPQRSRRKRVYSVRWLCLRPPAQLEPDERAALDQVLAEDEEVARGYRLLQQFRQVVAERSVAALDHWLRDAEASELAPFVSLATGLREDRAAVEAALKLPWSNGPTEGTVTRIKLVKRQGYGRAKLDLLRSRLIAR